MKRRIAAVAAAGLLAILIAPPTANALFGIGMPVFDVTAVLQLIRQIGQMEQEFQELVQTYDVIVNRYKLAMKMAEHFSAKSM